MYPRGPHNIKFELDRSEWWDLELSQDEEDFHLETLCYDASVISAATIIHIDVGSGCTASVLESMTEWTGATVSGFTVSDIGLTGIDNLRVRNLTGEQLSFSPLDKTFKMYPVGGRLYSYPYTLNRDRSGCYIELGGGFYQGFFKLQGYDYEVAPVRMNKGWTAEMYIKLRDDGSYAVSPAGTTLNDVYTGNTGFFFFMGARAENKFWNVYAEETGQVTAEGNPIPPASEKTLIDDVVGNCIGFRITPDRYIGYRSIVLTGACVDDVYQTGYTVEERYSDMPIAPMTAFSRSDWYYIAVRYSAYKTYDDCMLEKLGPRKGVLTVFVNARPYLRIEDFDEFICRSFNEYREKQIGVPFTFSFGGGSQGLIDNYTFGGGPDPDDLSLPIEENFAGSLYGGISQFRFLTTPLDFTYIIRNFKLEQSRYRIWGNFGGRIIIIDPNLTCNRNWNSINPNGGSGGGNGSGTGYNGGAGNGGNSGPYEELDFNNIDFDFTDFT